MKYLRWATKNSDGTKYKKGNRKILFLCQKYFKKANKPTEWIIKNKAKKHMVIVFSKVSNVKNFGNWRYAPSLPPSRNKECTNGVISVAKQKLIRV